MADSLTWLSIIPSIFVVCWYAGADSLHLGTVHKIDFAEERSGGTPKRVLMARVIQDIEDSIRDILFN